MDSEIPMVRFRAPLPTYSMSNPSQTDLVFKIGTGEHLVSRVAHKLVLARLSSFVEQLLLGHDDEETEILFPDMTSEALDLILTLAYEGYIRGLSPSSIRQVRDVCDLLNIRQELFIVRAEENLDPKSYNVTSDEALLKESSSNTTVTSNSFQCSTCSKTFIYAKSYERHSQTCNKTASDAHGDTVVLGTQEKRVGTVADKKDSKLHDSNEQDGPIFKFRHFRMEGELYFCSFPGCDYQEPFKTAGGCKNHQLRQHATEEEKIFACNYCDSKFASNQLRNKHQNLMHNKRFACDQCNKVFSEKTRLIIHMRIHSGEKPFVCESCGFSCSQRDNLRLHKEFKHPSLGRQEKKFTCDICSASFLTKSNLSRHRMSHSDLKCFVCETCGKAFKDPGALKQHTYSHGAPDYECGVCGQKFTSPLYLNRHIVRLHPTDGVQPLTCGSCGRGFALNHQLQEHIQAVHHNVKHCCPHCNIPIGRRSSVNRHIKKGRCRAMSLREELPDTAAQLLQIATITLPQMSSLTS